MWKWLVRWLAREHIAYLEYENQELRYEGQRWRHRYEGAMDAVRVFEARHNYMLKTIADAELLKPSPPIILNDGR